MQTTVLSWNIAECNPSSESTWDRKENVRRIEQLIAEKDADVLSIQEVPTHDWFQETNLCETYKLVGNVSTHCGFTMILVKSCMQARCLEIRGAPAIGAIVDGVAYVAMHLAPFKINSEVRLEQMRTILASIPPSVDKMVIVGDTNMRKTENAAFECLGIVDAWREVGEDKNTEYTWDSRINRYHSDGYPFTSRFDRAYMKGLSCRSFGLIANEKSDGAYLSDHFGILFTF